jgi:hypothetical protein
VKQDMVCLLLIKYCSIGITSWGIRIILGRLNGLWKSSIPINQMLKELIIFAQITESLKFFELIRQITKVLDMTVVTWSQVQIK